MSSVPPSTPTGTDDEAELTADEVARQLGLPVDMLVRRIEAGQVPARRVERDGRVQYLLRPGELGVAASRSVTTVLAPDVQTVANSVPPPARASVELAPYDVILPELRSELAAASLDPHQVLAGLLDRWQLALEQRAYVEQIQRFQGELDSRQAVIRDLRAELDSERLAHQTAVQERDRRIADMERRLDDRRLFEVEDEKPRRRGWFRR